MTDNNYWEESTADEAMILPVEKQEEQIAAVQEPQPEATPAKVEKPAFPTGGFASLSDGKAASSFRQITSGAQVAYVNYVFGLDGDQYTDETTEAVKEYQQKNNLRVTGKVSPALYRNL